MQSEFDKKKIHLKFLLDMVMEHIWFGNSQSGYLFYFWREIINIYVKGEYLRKLRNFYLSSMIIGMSHHCMI